MGIIKTPDQRVRVFISSTINELGAERRVAREAISSLRLTPVFFEAGARPHPPRDLYSAYLDQSHIFLGIYWNSYGWIAPGADISGLEDEYRLCGKKPKLIYVKRSEERQEKLKDLLKDIEQSDTACYQMFSDTEELRTLIENDLSILMSEAFENALFEQQDTGRDETSLVQKRLEKLPLVRGEMIGRQDDMDKLCEMLRRPDVSLVSLLGAGGTGKTTLAVHAAHAIKDDFRDGAVFVPLAPVTDHTLLASTIAEYIDMQDSGKQSIDTALIEYLVDKHVLIVLDNFEQIIDASRLVSNITMQCREVKLIVTTRTSLHIRNERIYNLSPLAVPSEATYSEENLRQVPAARLFIERAMAANPAIILDEDNIRAIVEICQRLDGLPLAIELAAARTKFFQPAALMSRINKTLDLVSKGHKDLPERQQTLRGAIEWSYNLLSGDTQKVFRQLGIFKRLWTMDAADAVINDNAADIVDIEEMTERLLDVSLIAQALSGRGHEPRFNMLQTVHEYAAEKLAAAPEYEATQLRYAQYYLNLLSQTEWILWQVTSEPWLDKIEEEFQNIRATFYIFIGRKMHTEAWDLFAYMVSYWSMRGGYSEGAVWMTAAGIEDPQNWQSDAIPVHTKVRTLTWAGLTKLMLLRMEEGFALLGAAEDWLNDVQDEVIKTLVLVLQGCYGTFMRLPGAGEKLETGKALAEKSGHPFPLSMLYLWSFQYFQEQGREDIVEYQLRKVEEISREMGYVYILVSRFNVLQMMFPDAQTDDTERVNEAREMIALMPEKGYKGLKAAVYAHCAYCLYKAGKVAEAVQYGSIALDYARESGEKENEMNTLVTAALLLATQGITEKAAIAMGAAESYSKSSGYPLVGSIQTQFEEARDLILAKEPEAEFQTWLEKGRKTPLEKAMVMASEH